MICNERRYSEIEIEYKRRADPRHVIYMYRAFDEDNQQLLVDQIVNISEPYHDFWVSNAHCTMHNAYRSDFSSELRFIYYLEFSF